MAFTELKLSFLYLSFDEKSLRKFDSSLESFRHKDFKYIISEKRNSLFNPDEFTINVNDKKEILKRKAKSKKKLPNITELLPSARNYKPKKSLKSNSSLQIKPRRNSVISQYRQKVNPETGLLSNCYNLDIDRFLIKKTREVLNSPWDLNAINATFTGVSKTTFTPQESTENLISKLKNIFREKYNPTNWSYATNSTSNLKNNINAQSFQYDSSQLSSLTASKSIPKKLKDFQSKNNSLLKNEQYYINNRNEGLYLIDQPTNNYYSVSDTPFKLTDNNASIYIKKLNSNYYDRKLWYSLLLNSKDSKFLNVYAEKAYRDYNSEFNILNHSKNFDFEKRKYNIFFNF